MARILFIILFFLCPTARAQDAAPADISAALEAVRAKHSLPALGGAIFSDRALLAIGACGVRDLDSKAPVTTSDLWHLGSCTKAMTATLIGGMVEKGELSWDLTLADALPDLAPAMHEDYRAVTRRQLLTMTAGVPSDLSADGLWARLWERQGTPTRQREQLARALLGRPPLHKPGSKFLYSNASFAIAGFIAETKSGAAWETLITERVFTPLGITSAGFGAPGDASSHDQPRGHGKDDKPEAPGPNADNPPAIAPAGTVHMSMSDWAKFLMSHVRGGSLEPALLTPKTFRTLHTPAMNEYAMGWGCADRPWGGSVITHAGSNTMWYCVTWLSPEKKFGVLVCTNTAQHDAPKAADEVAAMLIGEYKKRFEAR